jgi:hypothetical protein
MEDPWDWYRNVDDDDEDDDDAEDEIQEDSEWRPLFFVLDAKGGEEVLYLSIHVSSFLLSRIVIWD